jgi:hypothetical protein
MQLQTKILALPTDRETLIESGALPYYADLLRHYLSEWSEDSVAATWIGGFEFDVWLQIHETEGEHKLYGTLRTEQKEIFLKLSELIGGWIVYTDDGYLYMPTTIWLQYFRETQSEEYCERLRKNLADKFIHFSENMKTESDASYDPEEEDRVMEEINAVIKEVRNEVAAEKAAGTYVEPISSKRRHDARAAYQAWRSGTLQK